MTFFNPKKFLSLACVQFGTSIVKIRRNDDQEYIKSFKWISVGNFDSLLQLDVNLIEGEPYNQSPHTIEIKDD